MAPDLRRASAPVVAVLLILTLVAVLPLRFPVGEPVVVAFRCGHPPLTQCDVRYVVVHVHSDRSLTINSDPISYAEFGPRLNEIYKTRVDRVVCVSGAPELSFGEVAHVIAIVRQVIPNVGLLPPPHTDSGAA
jgi:biopolymer transport protein ExbD